MAALAALAPILLLFGLLTGPRWSAAAAGSVAALAAGILAVVGFGYGSTGLLPDFAGPLIEAAFTMATVLWIIFPALCIHEYQTSTGANALFGRWLDGLSDDPRIDALLLAWFFALFLEGAAGFGTPIALAAPLLVAIGFTPVTALTLAILGNAAGVSFGAIGTPMVPLLTGGAFDAHATSLLIILLHAAVGWTMAVLIHRMAGEERVAVGGVAGLRWAGAAALLFFVPAALLAWAIGPELPTLGGALVGGAIFVFFIKRYRPVTTGESPASGPELLRAASPYLAIVAIILLTRLIPSIAEGLRAIDFEWQAFGRFGGRVAPLHHPGTMLMLGFLATSLARKPAAVGSAMRQAAARLPMIALALLAVLLLARLMVHSGMVSELATSAADTLGRVWPLLAPMVGALGSFMTGSATASNILLGDFQISAAERASLSPTLMTAAQAFGAAAGNIVAPHNLVAGAATVGLIGREGEVLRRVLLPCLFYVGAGGVLILVLSHTLFQA